MINSLGQVSANVFLYLAGWVDRYEGGEGGWNMRRVR